MAITNFIMHISQNYLFESQKNFTNNELADYIRNKPHTLIPELVSQQYHIDSSPGQSKWSFVPWVGIFDEDISTSALRGYYIVYLFTEDMKGVYLSLNQGWSFFQDSYSKPKEKIKHVAAYWKKELSTIPNDFSIGEIYLKSYKSKQTSSGRPSGYANGNICSKYYDIQSLPDEKTLMSDLLKAILMLTELKSKLIKCDYIQTNNFILTQQVLQQESLETDREETLSTLHANSNIADYTFTRTPPPTVNTNSNKGKGKQTNSNIDYASAQSRNKKIGYAGELAVLELERQKLQSSTNPSIQELSTKVQHISVEKGDGLGYDIRSFDEHGEEMFIEVKTTTQNINVPFYLTENELRVSKKSNTKYHLYRLYEFGKSNNIQYYVLNGNLDEIACLKPINYSVLPKSI